MPLSLLTDYHPLSGRYDEVRAPDGSLRPAWAALQRYLEQLQPGQLPERVQFMRRRILENGVTYNVYADPEGADRPWALDPFPLMLDAREWAGIEAAVQQRAQLLDAALADLYGPQTLLSDGLLPPALVYGQSDYLWPCRGTTPPGGRWLHHYAADLARSRDGRWWVIADRTQTPSGAGYALENRLTTAQTFAELFRTLPVAPLGGFFDVMRDELVNLASPDAGEKPNVVLLTPGPYNETYFEHVYLSRQLGLPLVEGRDLTVRGETVYLKTLRGLQRVHVIHRRQDDAWCDPLELRGESALGVAGLLHAVRAGRVAVTNALGSGLMAGQALMGFLPGICARLLGEPLRMPSVATWWCGEEASRRHVLDRLDSLVVKSAFASSGFQPAFGPELSDAQREALARQIAARPHAYVAQEMVRLSQAPTWQPPAAGAADDPGRLEPRVIGIRVHAVATPAGYAVLPGGLGRAAGEEFANVLTMQRGGLSKDVWVLGVDAREQPRGEAETARSLTSADIVRSGAAVPSRVVENQFWMGRYAERLEGTARLLRTILTRRHRALGDVSPAEELALDLAYFVGVLEVARPRAGRRGESVTARIDRELRAALFDDEQPGSIRSVCQYLNGSAAQVRDRLSVDHWNALTQLQLEVHRPQRPHSQSIPSAQQFLERVLRLATALTGYANDHMTRDEGWRFLALGRRVERLIGVSSTIAYFLRRDGAARPGALDWLLELHDSSITYRSRYVRAAELLPTLDLLVLDESNPRSVLCQFVVLRAVVERLQRTVPGLPDGGLLQAQLQKLHGLDLDGVVQGPQAARRQADLAHELETIAHGAGEASDLLGSRFFAHAREPHQTLTS